MQSREDIERGARLGAANFLIKSMLTINEIIAEVKKVLDKSKQPVQPAPAIEPTAPQA
jgi:hypothetical protein